MLRDSVTDRVAGTVMSLTSCGVSPEFVRA
jgi:hypothetical protein